jgi:uncharacterized protein (TIGR02145 family)
MNPNIDTLIDHRDGNRYKIVKIDNRWWMAENLRYGKLITTNQEPTDNDTVERYVNTQAFFGDTTGGAYQWHESMHYEINNPKGICPDGWHIPTEEEWKYLFDSNPIYYGSSPETHLHSFLEYGEGGYSGLNLDLGNNAERWEDGSFWWTPHIAGFWSSSSYWHNEYALHYPYVCYFNSETLILHYHFPRWSGPTTPLKLMSTYLSVRCIKNL